MGQVCTLVVVVPFDVMLFLRLQIRKLRRELDASQEKVSALTTQLSANVRTRTQTNTWLNIWSCMPIPLSVSMSQGGFKSIYYIHGGRLWLSG